MNKRITISILLAIAITPSLASASPFDEQLPQISWADAAKYYNQKCIVYGKVVAAKDIKSRCFLNFSPDFRTSFTVTIAAEDYAKFTNRPDLLFNGNNIRVVGTIVEFKNKPEIVVDSPECIQIVDSPEPPKGHTQPINKQKPPRASIAPTKPHSSWKNLTDGVVTIATYNVFNLFDDFDDPYIENERLPGKSEDELQLLANTIRIADADVLALQEVENRPFLSEFNKTYLAEMGYKEVVLFEGNNGRGIDVALLSRIPVGPVVSYRHLEFPDDNGQPSEFQRDLLQVRLQPSGLPEFTVFVVHLKSKYGGSEKSLPVRMGEARKIRSILDKLLTDNPKEMFLICGDYNDTFDSKPLQHIVGVGQNALTSFHAGVAEKDRITFNKEPHRSMIDFILASPAMARLYLADSYRIIPGTVASSGSDHNPVLAKFKLK